MTGPAGAAYHGRMRYLVDGYNVTKGDPATRDLPIEGQRTALVARLATRGRDLLGSGDVLVVFDGRAGLGGGERQGAVSVRYSRDESADELIVRVAREAVSAFALVTSDHELAQRAADAAEVAVEVRGRESVYGGAKPRRRRAGRPGRDEESPPDASAITKELKDLWLSKEE